jgi:hypothetical protein
MRWCPKGARVPVCEQFTVDITAFENAQSWKLHEYKWATCRLGTRVVLLSINSQRGSDFTET